MKSNFAAVERAYAAIDKLIEQGKRPVIVGIDGRCGAGKTTLASEISQKYQATTVHCDDFFLPDSLKTPSRLEAVGGNIHFERLLQVLENICGCQPFFYEKYNCRTKQFVSEKYTPSNVVVVEGSYAFSNGMERFYDVKIFVTTDKNTQQSRLKEREGSNFSAYKTKWIPLEERYIANLPSQNCIIAET